MALPHVGSSQTRDRTGVSCFAGWFLTTGPPGKLSMTIWKVLPQTPWFCPVPRSYLLWNYRCVMQKPAEHFFFFLRNCIYLFLIDWWLLYSIGLISATHQHELAIGVADLTPWVSKLWRWCPRWMGDWRGHPFVLIRSAFKKNLLEEVAWKRKRGSITLEKHWSF